MLSLYKIFKAKFEIKSLEMLTFEVRADLGHGRPLNKTIYIHIIIAMCSQ